MNSKESRTEYNNHKYIIPHWDNYKLNTALAQFIDNLDYV